MTQWAAAIVFLPLCTTPVTAGPVARVGIAGQYGTNYEPAVGQLGGATEVLSDSDLADAGKVRGLDLLIISHLESAPSVAVEQTLAQWVADGGKLWLEINALPPRAMLDAPSMSGWAPYVEVLQSDSPLTRGERVGASLKYGAWGAGITTDGSPQVRVLARWRMGARGDFSQEIAEAYRSAPAAMLEIKYGKGLCVWSGAGLWILRPGAADGIVTELIGAEKLPLVALRRAIATDVSQEMQQPWPSASAVGVFSDPGFPRVGLPAACDGKFISGALTRGGFEAKVLSAEDLLKRDVLDARNVGVVVLGQGEAFPFDAVGNLKRFLAQGGGLLSCAGIPLAHLYRMEGGVWQDLSEAEPMERGCVTAVFEGLLPLSKVFVSDDQPALALNVAPDWLPGLPTTWPLRGGDVFLISRGNGLSSHMTQRLVASVSKGGDVMGLPVSFSLYDNRFPRARFLALGFRGDSHPLNPEAWSHAAEALQQCVKLVARRNYVYVADLWTREPLYYDGEAVELGARILGRTAERLRCRLWIQRRDDGGLVHSEVTDAALRPGEPTDLAWTWRPGAFDTWAYDVILEVAVQGQDPPPAVREETEFLAWREDVARSARGFEIGDDGVARRNGQPAWLSGANEYTCDARGVGFFYSGDAIPGHHALVDFADRDESWIKLVGGNAVRQHYFEYKIMPDSFGRPGVPHELRLLDAYNLLAGHHDHVSLCDPFTFGPARRDAWKAKYGDGDPYVDDEWRSAEGALYRGMAGRCAGQGFKNIVWELINEPEAYGSQGDEARRRELAGNVARWVREMQAAVGDAGGGPAGIGHSTAPASPAWDPRGNLFPLPLSNVHHYGQARLRTGDGTWCPAFGLNYGRPCVVGEFGLPNAGESPTPFLSDWSGPYDRVLHACLGENATGFINFYLNCGMGGVNSPEWGMIRPDYSEKPAGLVWKRWNQLLRFVSPDEFEPTTLFILFDSDDRLAHPRVLRELYEGYVGLLAEGVYARIASEKDLESLLTRGQKIEAILRPEGLVYRPETEALNARAKAAGASLLSKADEMVAFASPRLRVHVEAGRPGGTYVRPLKDGGCLVVLLEGTGDETRLRANGHELRMRVPEGRCATVRFTQDGTVRLVEAYGLVSFDGEPMCSSPDAGYLVAARDGKPISQSRSLAVWADDPAAVSLPGHEPGLRALDGAIITPGDGLTEPAQDLMRLLSARGIETTIGAPKAGRPRVLLSLPGDRLLQGVELPAQVRIVSGPGKVALHSGSARVDLPWSGAIVRLSDAPLTVAVIAPTRAGVELAVRKLACLRSLGTYMSGPFAPLNW